MSPKMFAAAGIVAAGLGLGATLASAAPGNSNRPASAPDTACMQAGIGTLQGAGLLPTVAANGLPISDAIGLGVLPRDPEADLSGVPDPIPFNVVLADHRAGDNSIFVYPWCD